MRLDDPRAAWVWVSLRTPHDRNLAHPRQTETAARRCSRTGPCRRARRLNLADAVPALVSCLQVSLERLGSFVSAGFQLTCLDMGTSPIAVRKGQGSAQDDLMYALPYLAGRDSDRTQSVLAFDERLVAAGIQRELLSRLGEDGDAWPFVFGPPALIVEQFRSEGAAVHAHGRGFSTSCRAPRAFWWRCRSGAPRQRAGCSLSRRTLPGRRCLGWTHSQSVSRG